MVRHKKPDKKRQSPCGDVADLDSIRILQAARNDPRLEEVTRRTSIMMQIHPKVRSNVDTDDRVNRFLKSQVTAVVCKKLVAEIDANGYPSDLDTCISKHICDVLKGVEQVK